MLFSCERHSSYLPRWKKPKPPERRAGLVSQPLCPLWRGNPWPTASLDLLSVRPPRQGERPQACHLLMTSSPPGLTLLRALCLYCMNTCVCTHLLVCTQLCLHLGALYVPGCCLNSSHPACPSRPLTLFSRVQPCLGCLLRGLSNCSSEATAQGSAWTCSFGSLPRLLEHLPSSVSTSTIQDPCWEHSDIAPRPRPNPHKPHRGTSLSTDLGPPQGCRAP